MTSQPIARAGGVQLEAQTEKLIELIEVLNDIDTTTPEAEQNATSISDNNGGRILL